MIYPKFKTENDHTYRIEAKDKQNKKIQHIETNKSNKKVNLLE